MDEEMLLGGDAEGGLLEGFEQQSVLAELPEAFPAAEFLPAHQPEAFPPAQLPPAHQPDAFPPAQFPPAHQPETFPPAHQPQQPTAAHAVNGCPPLPHPVVAEAAVSCLVTKT